MLHFVVANNLRQLTNARTTKVIRGFVALCSFRKLFLKLFLLYSNFFIFYWIHYFLLACSKRQVCVAALGHCLIEQEKTLKLRSGWCWVNPVKRVVSVEYAHLLYNNFLLFLLCVCPCPSLFFVASCLLFSFSPHRCCSLSFCTLFRYSASCATTSASCIQEKERRKERKM